MNRVQIDILLLPNVAVDEKGEWRLQRYVLQRIRIHLVANMSVIV